MQRDLFRLANHRRRLPVGIRLCWPASKLAIGSGCFRLALRGFAAAQCSVFLAQFHALNLTRHALLNQTKNQSSPLPKLEVEGFDKSDRDYNHFEGVRREIAEWRRLMGLAQRRQAVRSRWSKLRANRQVILTILRSRLATLRMRKSDISKRKKPSQVTSRNSKSDKSYSKR